MVVRVHFPEITEEERKRRHKQLHDAAAQLLKEKIRNETNGS
jgi:ribosome recycling factor